MAKVDKKCIAASNTTDPTENLDVHTQRCLFGFGSSFKKQVGPASLRKPKKLRSSSSQRDQSSQMRTLVPIITNYIEYPHNNAQQAPTYWRDILKCTKNSPNPYKPYIAPLNISPQQWLSSELKSYGI